MSGDFHDLQVLRLDTNAFRGIGTANPTNLYSMWTDFSRCTVCVEQGSRLNNLRWRLWRKEQIVENVNKNTTSSTTSMTTATLPKNSLSETRSQKVPQLSSSVESVAETDDFTSIPAPLEIRPGMRRVDSSITRTNRHISSGDFQKMTASMAKDKAPLPKHVQPKKQPARFPLDISCSSTEHIQSIEESKITVATARKEPMLQIGGSSREDSLKSSGHSSLPNICISNLKAQAMQQSESTIDSNTDAKYINECAINDNESFNYEDYTKDGSKHSVNDKFFQRVKFKPNQASRPSLITLMLAERARTLRSQVSQYTPNIHQIQAAPKGPCLGVSPKDYDKAPLMIKGIRHSAPKTISEIPRTSAQPITTYTTHVNFPAAFSPQSTRRNILDIELTKSLRLNLIWERQQNKLISAAMLKRRRTSPEVTNLKEYSQKIYMEGSEDVEAHSCNQYLFESLDGYHSKGW